MQIISKKFVKIYKYDQENWVKLFNKGPFYDKKNFTFGLVDVMEAGECGVNYNTFS